MFWNKKEGESALPDLTPIKSPFSQELGHNQKKSEEEKSSVENVKSGAKNETIPEIEEEGDETSERQVLPSFPDSPIQKGFSQTAIKDAVISEDKKEESSELIKESLTEVKSSSEGKFKTVEVAKEEEEISPSIVHQKEKKINNPENKPDESFIPSVPTKQVIKPIPLIEKKPKEEYTPLPFKSVESKHEDVFIKIDKFYSARKALDEAKQQLNQVEDLLRKIRETRLREEQELENWERDLITAKSRIQEVNKNIFEKTG